MPCHAMLCMPCRAVLCRAGPVIVLLASAVRRVLFFHSTLGLPRLPKMYQMYLVTRRRCQSHHHTMDTTGSSTWRKPLVITLLRPARLSIKGHMDPFALHNTTHHQDRPFLISYTNVVRLRPRQEVSNLPLYPTVAV